MAKVSVVIPVYNVERYLGECLDSILGQTLMDIEVICVDDASTDASPRILADYAAKDPRVKVFHAEHGGAYRAREVALRQTVGEYIHFMDADDLLRPEAYARLVETADRENLDQIVFSSSVFTSGDSDSRTFAEMKRNFERRYEIGGEVAGRVLSGTDLMSALLDANRFFVSPPLRLIRRTVISGHDWYMPQATSRADNYFTPLSLLRSARACAVEDRYYRRRVRADSISTATGSEAKHFRNLLEVLSLYCRLPEFADQIADPDSPVSKYAAIVVKNLSRWMEPLSSDELHGLVGEVFADFPACVRMLICSGVLPSLARERAASRRRPRSLAALVLGRLKRLFGGRG